MALLERYLIHSNEGTRESLKLILSDHYDLILTDSLEQCLEVIKNAEVRILLLDIDKQTEIATAIRKIESEKADIKIVALGRNEEAVKSSGIDDYVMKPIKSDELLVACE